jgi:hypothetical protein
MLLTRGEHVMRQSTSNNLRPRWGLLLNLLVAILCVIVLSSCTEGRYFRTEQDAVDHFERNRQAFERAVTLFEQAGDGEFDVTTRTATTQAEDDELRQIAQALQFTKIIAVPRTGKPDQQYVQFELRGHPSAPYGLIFVPENHGPALDSVLSDVGGPSGVYLRVRNLGNRWFYYEYK